MISLSKNYRADNSAQKRLIAFRKGTATNPLAKRRQGAI
jgi:hypothetical protein